jgi:hypothetical protein
VVGAPARPDLHRGCDPDGLVEWVGLQVRSPRWWTATYHMLVMAAASACFISAVINGHSG